MRSDDAIPHSPRAQTTSALLETLESCGALRRGHFLLSSGLHSPAYVQCALLLESPERAAQAGEGIAALLAHLAPESVLAPALGGVIIGHEVARALGVPFRFAEHAGERLALRRGFELAPGERVVTSGFGQLADGKDIAISGETPAAVPTASPNGTRPMRPDATGGARGEGRRPDGQRPEGQRGPGAGGPGGPGGGEPDSMRMGP